MSPALRLSLATNVALLALIAVLLARHGENTPRVSSSAWSARTPPLAPHTKETADDLQPRPKGPALTPAAVAQLEQLGLSRDAIANGLIDDHTYRYDKRVRALQKKYAPKPVPRREMLAIAREGEAERIRELKEALGEDGYRAWDKETRLRRLNMGGVALDPAEADKAYQVQKEFEDKDRALQMAVEDGTTDEADAHVLYEQARQQLDHQLEALFGKDRLAEIRGAPNPMADVTRRFQDLNPTPEQAKAVLQAEGDAHAREAALVQQLKDASANASDLAATLKAITDAREQNLRQIFGTENYENAKRQGDSVYQKLTQYADAWGLQTPQIEPVYAAISTFHDDAARMRMAAEMSEAAGQSVNWRDINSRIEQARQQLEIGLAGMIGGEPVRRLQRNGVLDVR